MASRNPEIQTWSVRSCARSLSRRGCCGININLINFETKVAVEDIQIVEDKLTEFGRNSTLRRDGLAFFLAPTGSNISIGGGIGLPINLKTLKPTSPFVAVEFDTFQNIKWDPVNITPATHDLHCGINIKQKKRLGLDLIRPWKMNSRQSGPKKFSYGQLSRATNNFVEEHKLGEGGFGGVYRGFLKELNSYVAIKRISKGSKQEIKEYASEVKIISWLRHRNLVQLIGWCHEKKELLLVYDFMENGNLDSLLFKGKNLLTWVTRYKIAQGLASALLYLHEEWEQCVVHRDVKSSNVMLDSNLNAKLGDFGLARFVDHEKGSQTTILAGTMSYLAPECIVTSKASKGCL
ncbi:hypothetical protein ACSBR1_019372 [Camellia fascicularis]